MKNLVYILLFAFYFLHNKNGSAQNSNITFKPIPAPASFYTNCLAGVQDRFGYMWFATQNGLYRYDGYHYTSYFNDPLDTNSLAGNWVETICASSNGYIWLGTNGLDRLDPETGKVKHFRHNPTNPSSLSSNNVMAILEDREGTIWVGTVDGLNRLDPETETFTRYRSIANDPTTLSNNEVRALYEDRDGTLWVGTGNAFGPSDNPAKGGGLNRLNRKTGTFTRYLHDPKNSSSLADNRVRAMFEDSRGTFWVGTAGDGLHIMDRKKGIFQRHSYDPTHPTKLSRPAQKKIHSWVDDHITFIIEDAVGTIWIGTFENGVNRYDPGTKRVTHFSNLKGKVTDMEEDEIGGWACSSRDGVLWIGNWKSWHTMDPLRISIPYFTTAGPVYSIYQDSYGGLWYGGHTGLLRKNPKEETLQNFVHDPSKPFSLSDNTVQCIYEDKKGILWVGTPNGLNRFNRKTGTFIRYTGKQKADSGLTNKIIECIYEDRAGNFWVGTFQGGMNLMNRKTGRFTHYLHDPTDSNSLSSNQIKRILEDRFGTLWIGTYKGGLNKLNRKTGKFQRFLYGVDVNSLFEDSQGYLWVGTSNGLYRSNTGLNSFKRFLDPNAEIGGDIVIIGVLEDSEHSLWINSSVGIVKLDNQRNEVVKYGETNGLGRESLNTWAASGYFRGSNGQLFFGDGTGYYAFFPEKLRGNKKAPQIVVNQIRVSDQPLVLSKEGPLKDPMSQIKKISLSYTQNVFSLDFAGIHYSSPERNRHLFMLEGLDNRWRKAGTEKTANYYNIPPGHYTFRIRAANSDGVWNEKKISIIITPPWWATSWAYILYGLISLVAIGTFITWRERILKKEKLLLEEKVTVRTNELQKEKEKVENTLMKLKELQAQLVETEKINERLRISRELHDDIGGTLSGIVLYSHLAENQVLSEKANEAKNSLNIIQQSANNMVTRLNDIVWAITPEHNSLGSLIQKLEEYAEEMAVAKNIKVVVNIAESIGDIKLPVEVCHNIFLFGKEAINNAVKYSSGTILELNAQQFDQVIEVAVKDNGQGFNMSRVKRGNGLINMQKRADEAAAVLSLQSGNGHGTVISLRWKIT